MPIALTALFGLLLGSFLNVVSCRLPRGESVVRPASRCPSCTTAIKPWDNLPVVSWIALRGRCRSCRASISARYPIVEFVTAALAVAVVLAKGADRDAVLGLVLVLVLVPVALIDLDHRIIPNRITGPAAIAAVVVGLLTRPEQVPEQLIAGVAAGGFLLLAALAYPSGMGMGDVKLAAVLGLFLGRSVGVALLVALLAGTLAGAAIIVRKGAAEGRKTAVPFGPFLALGGVTGLLAGPQVIAWYVHVFVA